MSVQCPVVAVVVVAPYLGYKLLSGESYVLIFQHIEEKVVEMIKTVYDPEIPIDVYSLGLIYKIDLADDGALNIDMTLTAPSCPAADFIVDDMRMKVESVDGVTSVNINIVFEPEWNKDMMTEEAKLELGFL